MSRYVKVRAAKDLGKKFQIELASSFSGIRDLKQHDAVTEEAAVIHKIPFKIW